MGSSPERDPSAELSAEILGRLLRRRGAAARYREEGELDRGGQGAILRVWDEDLERHLAMKVLLGRAEAAEPSSADSRSLRRFLEEARVTGQLDHPGIVPVHELGLDAEGHVYFTMKLVQGRTLKSILELVARGEEGWTRTRALGVLQKVCEAMAYAHHKGVVHRDLKPANVMVGRFGEVFVMDWGLAKVLGAADPGAGGRSPATVALSAGRRALGPESPGSPPVTLEGDVVGTPAYMAPEQALGQTEEIGPHTDVYAVGAILYHLLAGHAPYAGPEPGLSNYAVWQRVQRGPAEPLSGRARDAPEELVAICEKAMERRTSARYRDMGELGADLAAFLEHRVVSAYRTGALVELRKWVERNRPLAGALAAGLLAVVVGLVASLALKSQSDENAELAEERRKLAELKRDEVLRLSALQDVADLLAEADRLWPAYPANLEPYAGWLERARRLSADLPVHRAKLAELRSRALPRSEEERRRERESHPDFAELVRLDGEIGWRETALRQRRDGRAAELPEVDWSAQPTDPNLLNAIAWQRAHPDRRNFGDEALAYVLARRATELAPENPLFLSTRAWAAFALGRDEEALETSAAVMANADEELRPLFEGFVAKLEELVLAAAGPEGHALAQAEIEVLAARRAELDARVDARRDWRFPEHEREARWWNNQLGKLIEELEALSVEETGLLSAAGISPEHGWSIPRRQAFAEQLRAEFADGESGDGDAGEAARAWEAARAGIQAAYPGLELAPQLGLVPIGPDPASGLWEFAHLQTGEVPGRDAEGRLQLKEESGLVFVLLPGGSFRMGAQSSDPAAPNYDPQSRPEEGPVREVQLAPFFLAKHEMTQGQWLRATGANPSYHQRSLLATSLLHPVEQVSWHACVRELERLGLALPSEAQWEYAARGNTTSAWWTGDERSTLAGAVNVADQAAQRAGALWQAVHDWPELDDGSAVHAPVDRYRPNPFGLHDVCGNVWEWCYDGYAPSHADSAFQDPVVSPVTAPNCVLRGGGYDLTAAETRSAARDDASPELTDSDVGLRPARAIRD